MKKFWLIFLNEYKRHVLRKRFLFAILSMPLFVAVMALIGFLSVWVQYKDIPVGYIDPMGIIINPQQVPEKDGKLLPQVESIRYMDEETAREKLANGEIQALFILTENYRSTGEVTMVVDGRAGNNAREDFSDFISYNLISDQPQPVITRLTNGTNLIIRSMDGTREMGEDNWMNVMLPILAGVLFIIAVNISGGYLLQAVVEEKENRTMEIIVTSVSPTQLMAGKVVGNLSVGLTQLITWILFSILALKIAPIFFPDMGTPPTVEAGYVLLMVATLIPAFVMVAAAMGAIGATATESREAQQIAGWFTLPIMIPLWFTTAIMFNPNGAIAVGMSLFPLTAPIALPLRAAFTPIPFWQIALTVFLLCALALFALWLSGRVFRLGMLRYGKRVSLKEAFKRS